MCIHTTHGDNANDKMKTSLSETFVWFTTFAFSLSLSKECGESDGNDNEVQQPAVFLFSSSTRSLKIVR